MREPPEQGSGQARHLLEIEQACLIAWKISPQLSSKEASEASGTANDPIVAAEESGSTRHHGSKYTLPAQSMAIDDLRFGSPIFDVYVSSPKSSVV